MMPNIEFARHDILAELGPNVITRDATGGQSQQAGSLFAEYHRASPIQTRLLEVITLQRFRAKKHARQGQQAVNLLPKCLQENAIQTSGIHNAAVGLFAQMPLKQLKKRRNSVLDSA